MNKLPYYERYLKQGSKCFMCLEEISSDEYCVINIIEGVRVINKSV